MCGCAAKLPMFCDFSLQGFNASFTECHTAPHHITITTEIVTEIETEIGAEVGTVMIEIEIEAAERTVMKTTMSTTYEEILRHKTSLTFYLDKWPNTFALPI